MGKKLWDVPNFLKEGLPVGIMGIGGHIYHISFSLDWAGYFLKKKPYMYDSKIIFGVWLFEKVWEISPQLVRAWDRLQWNHKTHDKEKRLGKSVFHKVY